MAFAITPYKLQTAPNEDRMSCDRRAVTVRNERQMPGWPIPADQSRHGERHRVMVNIAQRLRPGRIDCSGSISSDVCCS
jgi:hypothetical protein